MSKLKQRVTWAAVTVALMLLTGGTAKAEWRAWSKTDEMTGETTRSVMSEPVEPTKKLEFPYSDLKGAINLVCHNDDTYFALASMAPVIFRNRPTSIMGLRAATYELRVRFDEEKVRKIEVIRPINTPGFFPVDAAMRRMRREIFAKSTLLIEVPLLGAGDVIFRFNLEGSRDAFEQHCMNDQ